MSDLSREQDCKDSSGEPIEVKLIAAASNGLVEVTPEKCERVGKLILSYAAEARAGMREACAKVAEALALKLCWHCAEHVKNGYRFMLYGHTEVDLDLGDPRQIYAAAGTGENWSHLTRTESGREWTEKCKAWMLWSVVYEIPDLAADEAIERIKREARLEEAKWWHPHDSYHHPGCVGCKRIAALSGKES